MAHAPGRAEPVAACPGCFYDLDLATVRSPARTPLVEAIRRCRRSFLFSRVYELGSPTPLTGPFLVPDARLLARAVEALLGAAVEEARRHGAALMLVQNFTAADGTEQSRLARLGFARVPMPPTAVLEVSHDSFGDYLAAMRAPYRRRARQALRRSDALRTERIDDFADLADELARLWRRVFERAHEVKREVLTPAFFRAASRLGQVTVVALRRPDGSIASYAVLLEDKARLAFLHCGFEAEAGGADGAYFRLLYEIVRTGIEGGFRSIDFGMTTLAPKLDVGAVPVQLYAWVRHANPAVQRLIRLLANGPLRPTPVPSRRVFKTASAISRAG